MKYIITYQKDAKIKKLYLSEEQYLKGELPLNIISIKKSFDASSIFKKRKLLTNKMLISILYELSMMLDANILFDDAFDILIDSSKDLVIKEFLEKLKYSYINHIDLENSLKEYKIDSFIISSLKIIQTSGNPKKHVKTLYEILNEEENTKAKIKKAFSYPLVLLFSFVFALIGMFKFVVPKFESMFLQNSFELNTATKVLFFVKNIYDNHIITVVIVLFSISSLAILFYYKNKDFKYFIHKLLFEKLFIVSKIYKFRLMYRFFYVLNSLLSAKYEFHETIKKSKTLINNKYFLDRITRIDTSLKSGKTLYQSFKEADVFDNLVLNVIKIAEVSNCMEETSYEIRTIYKKRFNEKVRILSVLIEPIFFILIMLLIVWIIAAIFVPLWSIGDVLKN